MCISKTYAEDKENRFLTEHNIIYKVDGSGNTVVNQNVTITNLKNDVIATSYSVDTSNYNILNEEGLENDKSVPIKKEIGESGTSLKIFFDDPTIGEGKQKKFSINYNTTDIARKSGDVWNVNIPKSQITEFTSLYNVKLIIAKSLGPRLFTSPTPAVQEEDLDNYIYYFTKEDLTKRGIAGAFGKYQTVNFKLTYQLQNKGYFKSTQEIALPPDVKGYQQVKYIDIYPTPKNIYIDKDGNTIAQYKLKSKEYVQVEVTGSAKIYTKQIDIKNGGNIKDIPQDLVRKYTKDKKYWDVNSKAVQSLVDTLYNKDLNVSQNVYLVYNFITKNLAYDTSATNKNYTTRLGAESTLISNSAVTCMGFSDLFITLVRAMNIPAREINGFAFTQDQKNPISINLKSGDTLHSWGEFYDPAFGWVQVDPTWGNTSQGIDYFTKLDTNHFSFVIRGLNSEYPLSAGMYRVNDSDKLVNVDFSSEEVTFEDKLVLYKKINFNPIYLLKGYKKYKLVNEGDTIIHNINGRDLPPNESISIYLSEGNTEVFYKDANGNTTSLNAPIKQ